MPRILILDEHTVYRVGLARLTGAKFPGAEVVEATNLNEVLPQIRERVFNLALVGIRPSSSEALDFLKAAREALPATRLAVLATSA